MSEWVNECVIRIKLTSGHEQPSQHQVSAQKSKWTDLKRGGRDPPSGGIELLITVRVHHGFDRFVGDCIGPH